MAGNSNNTPPEPSAKKNTAKFSKEQLISSSKYGNRKDALSVLLDSKKMYSHEEVEKKLKEFYERKVT